MRRGVLLKILEEWINVYRDDAVVDVLLEALSTPGFMDVKLRDAIQNKERFLKTSCIRYIQLNPIKTANIFYEWHQPPELKNF